ncbi:Dynein heavy chain 11, axonemal [Manis javanica]|nr:Dynein heavy chain 11, axonemal [Manis javanica]
MQPEKFIALDHSMLSKHPLKKCKYPEETRRWQLGKERKYLFLKVLTIPNLDNTSLSLALWLRHLEIGKEKTSKSCKERASRSPKPCGPRPPAESLAQPPDSAEGRTRRTPLRTGGARGMDNMMVKKAAAEDSEFIQEDEK